MPRIAVFTGDPSFAVRKGIIAIDRAVAGTEWLIVVAGARKSASRLLRNQWLNLKRNGWRWIPYQLADLAARLRPSQVHGGGGAAQPYAMASLRLLVNVRILNVADLHAAATLEAVREFAPDLGLSMAAPILRRPLFSLPRLGTVNLHKGKVPDYRGMPPAFWELWNNEQSVGCTVHFVDDQLDTGDLVAQTSIAREKYSTIRGLQLRLDEVGIALMRQAVGDLLAGRAQPRPQPTGGHTYRKPTLGQIAQLTARLKKNMPTSAPPAKQAAKDAYARAVFTTMRAGLRSTFAPRISVLLYHRVSDDARDNLTVGVEQFDRQMALIQRYCHVLSIDEVRNSRSIPKSTRPLVCVTFDDGYLDNYVHAAPILLRHGVPAAFFVATGLIGTDGRFPHDVRRGNPPIPVMTWDQLREMQADGFTIGSHSVGHIDCASESKDKVWRELVDSRNSLRRELAQNETLFAYPYGGRQHMTAERLEMVKAAGYAGCLSAYGGVNIGTVDPYNILRRGIHWGFTDRAFLLECLALT